MDVFGANLLERAAAAAASWQELSHSFPHNCAAEIRTRLSIYIAKLYVSQKPDTLESVPQTGTNPETTCQPSFISVEIYTLVINY